jgi:hypothetical protein
MNSHVTMPTLGWIALAVWFLVLPLIGSMLSRSWSRDVTLADPPEVTPRSRLALRLEPARLRLWRWVAAALWRVGALLSGSRRRALERRSRRATARANRIEVERKRRMLAAWRQEARDRAWAAHMTPIPASSPSSTSLPPSAPEEDTRRWERTLPWGTPSPLMTREGLGRPYPFVPLAPPLAPRSSRRARRAP